MWIRLQTNTVGLLLEICESGNKQIQLVFCWKYVTLSNKQIQFALWWSKNIWKSSKNLKIFQKSENLPKIWKSSKNLKIFQKSENLPKICLIKCLKGHKSLGSLCSVVKTLIVSGNRATKRGTMSPIELFWTANKTTKMEITPFCYSKLERDFPNQSGFD